MAKKKGPVKVQPTLEPRSRRMRPVRLDLKPADHERLLKLVDRRGLTIAAFVRMMILEKLDESEGGK